MFVVTGTPRSATGYASLLFKAMQIPCTHERIFTPTSTALDIAKWISDKGVYGESSWLAWCYASMLPDDCKMLHTLRDPAKVIDSLAHRNDLIPLEAVVDHGKARFRELIALLTPRLCGYVKPLERAAVFYVDWIQRIRETLHNSGRPNMEYRVEEMDVACMHEILDFLEIARPDSLIHSALAETPRDINGGRHLDYGLKIENHEILQAIDKYMPFCGERVIAVAESKPQPLTRDEILDRLDSALASELTYIAHDIGYWR